jgi:hypothetical protein
MFLFGGGRRRRLRAGEALKGIGISMKIRNGREDNGHRGIMVGNHSIGQIV